MARYNTALNWRQKGEGQGSQWFAKNIPDIVLDRVLQLLGRVYHKHLPVTKLLFEPPPVMEFYSSLYQASMACSAFTLSPQLRAKFTACPRN